jgi:hypothetical protein
MSGSQLSPAPQLEILDAAAVIPESADIVALAQQLLAGTDLATGGSILLRLAQIIDLKASALFDGQQADDLDAVLATGDFSDFDDFGLPVVGRVEIDLDDLLLPPTHNYPPERRSLGDESTSTLSPDLMREQVLGLAHSEDIPGWSGRIQAVLSGTGSAIALPELLERSGLSLVELWLGLLLGGLHVSMEQLSEDFYSRDGIEVS